MKRIKPITEQSVDHKIISQPPPTKNVQVHRGTPTDASHHEKAFEHNTLNDTPSEKDIKNWIAWKWRWVVAAWKAKRLSHKMKELENGSKNSSRRDYDKANHMNRCVNPRIRKSGNVSSKVPMKTNSKTAPSPDLVLDDERMASSRLEDLQEQVARMNGCVNKMMPALVFLTKKAGNQKLAEECFRKWKRFSTTAADMRDHRDFSSPQQIKLEDCNNNSMTIALSPKRNLTIRTTKQQKVQRKPRMADVDLHRPASGFEANSTVKSLHALQTSVHHELQELQGLLATGIGVLQRKKPMSYNALMSVWETCESVAQVLHSARQRLRWCGPKESCPPVERPASPNRHRLPCHAIMTEFGRGGWNRARGAPRSPSPPPPPPSRTAVIELCDGESLGLKISAGGTPRDSAARARWRCTAAEHAARLRRQIERLRARERNISLRLEHG